MRLRSRVAVAALAAVFAGVVAGGATGVVAGGEPVETTRVLFAVDTSGSLRSEDLARAATLVAGVMDALPAGSEAALITFDDDARVAVPWASRHEDLRAALAALRPQGRRTAMNDALFDAARLLRDAPAVRPAIVLVTDGRDEGSAVELADGLAVAQQAGLPVFTVGVGRVEERVLRRIAKLTGGGYTRLAGAQPGALAARIGSAARTGALPGVTKTATADAAAAAPPAVASETSLARRALAFLAGLALAILAASVLRWRHRSSAGSRSASGCGRPPRCGRPPSRTWSPSRGRMPSRGGSTSTRPPSWSG